jgi:MFS superfamily sulfate permease-like transporter
VLSLWALVVPQAIAYAQIAGLPPETGLFATFAALLGYAAFGTSRPTSSTAAISAVLVAPYAAQGSSDYLTLSAGLALITGAVLVILGLLKLGFVSRFIATSVQVGFMIGLGLTIMVGQAPKLLGIEAESGDFFAQLWGVVSHLGDTNNWTATIGVLSLAGMFGLRRYLPAVPAGLVVVIAGILTVSTLGLEARVVAVMGDLEGALPSFVLRAIGWGDFKALVPGALAIAIIGYAESATSPNHWPTATATR